MSLFTLFVSNRQLRCEKYFTLYLTYWRNSLRIHALSIEKALGALRSAIARVMRVRTGHVVVYRASHQMPKPFEPFHGDKVTMLLLCSYARPFCLVSDLEIALRHRISNMSNVFCLFVDFWLYCICRGGESCDQRQSVSYSFTFRDLLISHICQILILNLPNASEVINIRLLASSSEFKAMLPRNINSLTGWTWLHGFMVIWSYI